MRQGLNLYSRMKPGIRKSALFYGADLFIIYLSLYSIYLIIVNEQLLFCHLQYRFLTQGCAGAVRR